MFQRVFSVVLSLLIVTYSLVGQSLADSMQRITVYSGSVGLTNNGFSIVPTFSLNAPAMLGFLSWKKSKCSIDPEIRLTLDGRKGSILLWLRYHAIQNRTFRLRAGIHPAMNLQLKNITDNGISSEITQMQRFIAWEMAPTVQVLPNWAVGLYYLQGNGLQKGLRTLHFVNVFTALPPIPFGKQIRLTLTPAFYYLNLDGADGTYFTASAMLKHKMWPFSVQSAINQTISSVITGNKEFIWNVSLNYHFKKKYWPLK